MVRKIFMQIFTLYLIDGVRHVHNLLHIVVAIAIDLSPQPGRVQYKAVLIGQLVEVQFCFLRPLLPEVRVIDVDVRGPLSHKASLWEKLPSKKYPPKIKLLSLESYNCVNRLREYHTVYMTYKTVKVNRP